MIVSNKEILYINSLIENAVDLFHNFWPMTSFIHHNPLHGFENMHFEKAIKEAEVYFHNKKFLSREEYQDFYKQGKIKIDKLEDEIEHYCQKNSLDDRYKKLFLHLFLNTKNLKKLDFAQDIKHKNNSMIKKEISNSCKLQETKQLGVKFGFCDALDSLYGTNLCQEMNIKLNKVAMRHLDEGQATWKPAQSEKGMFYAWKRLIKKDKQFFSNSLQICRILTLSDKPEDIIFWVLNELKIPKHEWESFFVLQFGKLHGWTGFLRWRSTNKEYTYQKKSPAFLEEFLAIRLYFLYMYLKKAKKNIGYFPDFQRLKLELSKKESFLRLQYHSGKMLPDFLDRYEISQQKNSILDLYEDYILAYNQNYIEINADFLCKLLNNFDQNFDDYNLLLENIEDYQEHEGFIYQKAMEENYIKNIMMDILPNLKKNKQVQIEAQLFFCIDTRSEGIRRNIEEIGNFETFGIGGFFGIPLKLIDISKKHESDLCPAVIKPKNIVYRFQEGDELPSIKLKKALKHMYHDLKYNTMSAYITVETIGLLFGFDFFGKSIWPNLYMPRRKKVFNEDYDAKLLINKYPKKEILSKIKNLQIEIIKQAIKENYTLDTSNLEEELDDFLQIITSHENKINLQKGVIEPKTRLALKLGLMHHEEVRLQQLLQNDYQVSYFYKIKHIEKLSKVGFTFKEQLFYAKNALGLTGLTNDFAPIVVLCGHESSSENNPYESALDCGACGGKSSDINARVMTYILNKPKIRDELKPEIDIPQNTIFISAIHNTVSDKVLIKSQDIPEDKINKIKNLQKMLDIATKNSALQRVKRLPLGEKLDERKALKFIQRNTQDWSQTRPEWGLATNHSFIIGPRNISKNIKFDNRVFLHSYDYKKDKIGYYLEIILSAPLVIAEWINMEHFFSSLDNKTFGSESKIYHNVVGRLGVISGNMSDLRTGLAAQSVHLKGKIYHEPIRLITFIDAPFYEYRMAVDKIKKVSQLVYNEWIKIIFIDRKEEAFFYYHGNSCSWKKIKFESLGEV